MKKILKLCALMVFAVTMALACVGCSASSDEKHPAFREAIKYRDSNDMTKAVEAMRRFLSIRPDSAKGHLELASMYDERLDMPLQAIYHYQEFLRLAPKSPEVKTVLGWLENVKRRYYEKMQIEFGDRDNIRNLQSQANSVTQERDVLNQENQSLREYIEKYKQAMATQGQNVETLQIQVDSIQAEHNRIVADLKRQLEHALSERTKATQEADTMKERLDAAEKALAESEAIRKILEQSSNLTSSPALANTSGQEVPVKNNDDWVMPENDNNPGSAATALQTEKTATPADDPAEVGYEGLEVVTTVPVPAPSSSAQPPAIETAVTLPTYYVVQSGDSLSKISRKFYGTSSKFLLIYNANSDQLKNQNDLHPGQKLYIPSVE